MSSLRVNKITNVNDNGPIEFSKGVILPEGKTLDDENSVSTIVVNTTGIMTAGKFNGIGIGITTFGVENEIKTSKTIALTLIT
jgi:hypothetical protein